ncbi:MAG: hypothetical protein HYX90_02760 [Chloroflexi bacterium]|nr:hypothetical protein [Chloroflexota bacterium]
MTKLHGSLICLVLAVIVSGFGCAKSTTPAPTRVATPPPTSTLATPLATAGRPYYQDKVLTIIMPFGAGGSADITGRVWSRHLYRFIPGNPTIIIRNMPGAGSSMGSNWVYTQAKPDGLTALVGSGSTLLPYLLGFSQVKYDLAKMPIVAAIQTTSVLAVSSRVVGKRDDLLKAKGMVFGGTAIGGSSSLSFVILREVFDFPVDRAVFGYSSNSEVQRALLSGEVNASVDGLEAYLPLVAPRVQKGELIAILQTGRVSASGSGLVRDTKIADIPTAEELYQQIYGKPPSGMAWTVYNKVIAPFSSFSKFFVLPPGTPDNIVMTLRKAAEGMMKDPQYQRDIASDTLGGESMVEAYKNLQISPEIAAWVKDLASKKYQAVFE